VAGIHEEGTALRMDDVPLPLRSPVSGPPAAAAIARALRERTAAGVRGALDRPGASGQRRAPDGVVEP